MRNVGKPLAVVALFGLAAWLVAVVLWPRVAETPREAAPPPPPPAARGVPADVLADLRAASDIDAPRRLRDALAKYRGRPGAEALADLLDERARAFAGRLAARVDELAIEMRYVSAVDEVETALRRWRDTPAAARAAALLEELRAEQDAQIRARVDEAAALLMERRYEAAREALRGGGELEDEFRGRLTGENERLERRIRVRQFEDEKRARAGTAPAGGAPVALVAGRLGPPPALPGYPHPDVKRLRDAQALYGESLRLFKQRRYQPALDALGNLVGYYEDLQFLVRRRESVEAMTLLSRHGMTGVAGLFRAPEASYKKGRLRLRYTFATPDEMRDWEKLKTIPHENRGDFQAARDGVRGTGAMGLVLRGFFKKNVRIESVAAIKQPRSHGLALCQDGNETRHLALLATNHWFVEGENYVKERPGHSILMFGKGVNADVPVDSPETGFIFRGDSKTSPDPPAGAEIELSFRVEDDTMIGEVGYRGKSSTLRGSSRGDDGRGVVRLRPALYVVDADVVFRDVRIEGTPDLSFENERVRKLLDAIVE